jgi:ABC-type glycerol-3-phosphate transport system substrate-binding protein
MLAVTAVSCSYGSEGKKASEANNNGVKGNAAADSAAVPELSIYYMINVNYISNAILEFKSKFPDVKINRKLFYVNSQDDFNKALSTEVLTGGGPDIIVCKPLKDLDSVSKIFSNGAFEDLNKFISSDKDFKLSDYNSVIKAGVLNGRREFVPLYYSLNVLHTTETILQQNDIKISEDCSISELSYIVKSFLKNEKRKSKYLFDSNFSFYYLLNCCQGNFLDYDNKKCDFNPWQIEREAIWSNTIRF